jgi:iron complex transport system ATP-binding protein
MTHVMKACDCLHLKDRLYPRLSGGEKQRVQLARVLLQLSQAQQPPLLLLDEPTSAQDLGQQHGLLDLARRLCNEEGYTVIAILHDLNQALRYSDRCTLINNGAIAEHGETEQVLTPCIVEQYWGYRPERAVVESGQHGLV